MDSIGRAERNLILWKDEDVCILHPNAVGMGIVVYHAFPLECARSIAERGLVLGTGKRSIRHPYHFFRAPAQLACNPVPPTPSLQCINMNYSANNAVNPLDKYNGYFCIRIDPARTHVYSSECRASFWGTEKWRGSRKTLMEFADVLKANAVARRARRFTHTHMYNLFTNELVLWDIDDQGAPGSVLTNAPPEYNSEILVRLDVIPSHWQVEYQRGSS